MEFAKYLREHGFDARRGVQFAGGADSPDVVSNVPGIHFEVKRAQVLRIDDWMAQAIHDAGADKEPVIAWRKDRGDWMAVLPMAALLRLVKTLAGRDD